MGCPEGTLPAGSASSWGRLEARAADYVRDGDTECAEGMKYLLGRFAVEYEAMMAKREKP